MSQKEQTPSIQRILVALDNSPASLAALREAIILAAGFEAMVVGLYIEDINLVRLAQMSISQEVGLFSGTSRRFEVHYVERQFKGQASRARQILARLATAAGVSWTFRTMRGVVAAELLNAASEADLVALGRIGLAGPGPRKGIGSTARTVLLQAPHLTLLLHPGATLGWPALALYDGSQESKQALRAASELAQALNQERLAILLLAGEAKVAERLQREVETALASRQIETDFFWQGELVPARLAYKIAQEGYNLLILPENPVWLTSDTLLDVLEQVKCPVLLVRPKTATD